MLKGLLDWEEDPAAIRLLDWVQVTTERRSPSRPLHFVSVEAIE